MEDQFWSENEDNNKVKGYLSEALIENIRKRIKEVIVPQGVSRIPSTIGTPKTGKLKANKWASLFGIYLPLIVLDLFWDVGPSNHLILFNIGALIQFTKIIGASSVTKENPNMFSQEYKMYQHSSNLLFPKICITPNYHYATHILEHLSRWGPLNGVWAVEETIMEEFGQFQRLQQVEPVIEVPLNESPSLILNQKILNNLSYLQLLKHLQKSHHQLRHYADLPHPSNSIVLQNLVCEPPYIPWRFGLKVSKQSPNNIIYIDNGKGEVGFARVAHILVLANKNIQKGPLLMVDWVELVQE
ncbi:hypothetical protein O181_017920 [Austropuccinia psidii MF-1]|uniref:Uncharacterized protein n=1 Tax=Austropuccinia psidii MF-1 TaxID=1389203 RepID=A0A9Q3C7P0_9BASI|nr:hypothetical protein [Austropuccinia psidii MF-1]